MSKVVGGRYFENKKNYVKTGFFNLGSFMRKIVLSILSDLNHCNTMHTHKGTFSMFFGEVLKHSTRFVIFCVK